MPVGDEIHSRSDYECDQHSGLPADGPAHKNQQQSQTGQENGCLDTIHNSSPPGFLLAAGKRKDLYPQHWLNAFG
jgi:hypothetical protein